MKALYNNGEVRTLAPEEESHVIRHTAAHIMAQAILRLHPQAKFAYGPATERGFYYDVDLGEEKLSDEELGLSGINEQIHFLDEEVQFFAYCRFRSCKY